MQSQEGFTVMKVLTIDYLNSSFFVTHPSNIYRKEKLLLFLPGQSCPDCLESSDAGTDEKDVISHLKPNVLVSLFQKSQPQKLFMTVLVYCS